MTFCGGEIAEDGLESAGRGRGVDIGCRKGCSLVPFSDFRRDFMVEWYNQTEMKKDTQREKLVTAEKWNSGLYICTATMHLRTMAPVLFCSLHRPSSRNFHRKSVYSLGKYLITIFMQLCGLWLKSRCVCQIYRQSQCIWWSRCTLCIGIVLA